MLLKPISELESKISKIILLSKRISSMKDDNPFTSDFISNISNLDADSHLKKMIDGLSLIYSVFDKNSLRKPDAFLRLRQIFGHSSQNHKNSGNYRKPSRLISDIVFSQDNSLFQASNVDIDEVEKNIQEILPNISYGLLIDRYRDDIEAIYSLINFSKQINPNQTKRIFLYIRLSSLGRTINIIRIIRASKEQNSTTVQIKNRNFWYRFFQKISLSNPSNEDNLIELVKRTSLHDLANIVMKWTYTPEESALRLLKNYIELYLLIIILEKRISGDIDSFEGLLLAKARTKN